MIYSCYECGEKLRNPGFKVHSCRYDDFHDKIIFSGKYYCMCQNHFSEMSNGLTNDLIELNCRNPLGIIQFNGACDDRGQIIYNKKDTGIENVLDFKYCDPKFAKLFIPDIIDQMEDTEFKNWITYDFFDLKWNSAEWIDLLR